MNLIYKLVDAFLIWQLGQRYVILSNFMSYELNYSIDLGILELQVVLKIRSCTIDYI